MERLLNARGFLVMKDTLISRLILQKCVIFSNFLFPCPLLGAPDRGGRSMAAAAAKLHKPGQQRLKPKVNHLDCFY